MQNQQLSDVKGKELVAAGHAFAKAMGMDTALIDIAKMVSELATRLDCALMRGDAHMQAEMVWEKAMMAAIGEDGVGCVVKAIEALKAQRDALAAENAALKESREVLAKNSLEVCNEVYCAGYRNTALHDGLMESTGNRNAYPNPIRAMVDEATRQLATPATDAYLNSVRAEGVEALTKILQVMIEAGDFAGDEVGTIAGAIDAGNFHANQLRAGEPS